jgi:subtilisin-like proprotein convertase family protein
MKTVTNLLGASVAAIAIGASLIGHAGIYNFTTSGGGVYTAGASGLGQVIPDNNPVGVAYALNFEATGLQISDIQVSLNVSGGWNGDLYAYLSHGSGFAVLLNRVGATPTGGDGYSTSGFNILLEPVATHAGIVDIHTVQNPSSPPAVYAADGRVVYTDASRPQTLDVFLNGDPNGIWTLFFADRAAVDASTLNSWSLDITAVPEPVNVALALFGVVFAGVTSVQWRLQRQARLAGSEDGRRKMGDGGRGPVLK